MRCVCITVLVERGTSAHVKRDEHVIRKAVGNSRNVSSKGIVSRAFWLAHVLSNKARGQVPCLSRGL